MFFNHAVVLCNDVILNDGETFQPGTSPITRCFFFYIIIILITTAYFIYDGFLLNGKV